MSRFLVPSTNNNTSTTTDDEETRINILFPKCKVRPQQESPGQTEPKSASGRRKCPAAAGPTSNFSNSLLLECTSDSNANREKKLSPGGTSDRSSSTGQANIIPSGQSFELLYIDNSQSAPASQQPRSVAEFLGEVENPGRGKSQQRVENVRGVPKRKEGGYHYNISNQRRWAHHNHNSCRSPSGIDLRRQELKSNPPRSPLVHHRSQFQKTLTKTHVNSSINNQETADGATVEKKLDKARTPPPQFQFPSTTSPAGGKMDFDVSAGVDEDSGHFDNGTGSGSNGSTFSESNTPGSGGGGTGRPGPLHDSRIEIAGGREIFSQNKTRAGRRGRGPSTLDYEPHFLPSPSLATTKGRRKVIPPGTAASVSPRYSGGSTKKSAAPALPNSHQGTSSTSTVWELQLERKAVEFPNKQFGAGAPPRTRNAVRHYYGSYKQKHKSGNGYGGQMRARQHSIPAASDYYLPPHASSSFHNFPRDPTTHHPLPRVHGTIKETMFGTEITSVEKSVVYDEMGRVVSCDQRLRTLDPTPPKNHASVVYGAYAPNPGDILFDDIEDWREVGGTEGEGSGGFGLKSGKTSSNLSPSPQYLVWEGKLGGSGRDNDDKRKLTYAQIMDSSSQCPPIQVEGNTSPSGYESDECSVSAAAPHPNFCNENKRLIGNLPIAEYEGSPRRYGLYRQPPGAVSMPNDLDLVDPCSGIQVSFPSSHSLEAANSTGIRSPETQESPKSTTHGNNSTMPTQQSPNGSGKRMPGFPQRILTNSLQAHQGTSTAAVGNKPQSMPMPQTQGNIEADMTTMDEILKTLEKFPGSESGNEAQERVMPPSSELGSREAAPVSVASHEGTPGTCRQWSGGTSDGGNPGASGGTEPRSLALSREQYDYLYEFSETRKVLEEFFHSSADPNCPRGGVSPSDFDELDYTLRRQNGNSYVGQRLAGGELCLGGGGGGGDDVEESPKIPHRRGGREVVMSLGIPSELGEGSEFGTSPRLITLHDVSSRRSSSLSPASKNSPADEGNRDVNDNDLDVETTSTNTETDLGETEIGHQVRHPRNYALSPESTDCDSNELESEMSLDYEVSVHSSSRAGGTTMPVLEDGLSSGNASENDEAPIHSKHGTGEAGGGGHESSSSVNPTLLLMKKQITEIEKEIQMRATTGTNQQAGSNGGGGGGMPMSGGSCGYFPGDLEELPSASPCQLVAESTALTIDSTMTTTSANANIKVHEVPLCDRRSNSSSLFDCNDPELEALDPMRPTPPPSPAPAHHPESHNLSSSTTPATLRSLPTSSITHAISPGKVSSASLSLVDGTTTVNGLHLSTPGCGAESKESISTYHTSSAEPIKLISSIMTPPDSAREPLSHRAKQYQLPKFDASSFTSLLPTKPSSLSMTTGGGPVCTNQRPDDSPQSELHESSEEERLGPHGNSMSPVWVPRRSLLRGDRNHHGGFGGLREPFLRKRYEEIPDDDADTDQETDRLLGQHRTEDDYRFYNEKDWKKTKLRGILASSASAAAAVPPSSKGISASSSLLKPISHVPVSLPSSTNNHSSSAITAVPRVIPHTSSQELPKHLSLNSPTAESSFPELPLSLPPSKPQKEKEGAKKKRNKEDFMKNQSVLIEGVLFRARYLGSTQLISEGQPTKATRMLQAEEAVSRIKAQANQNPPSGLSDSTASPLSSSSSSITIPLALSTSTPTTTDDEPTSPPRFHSATNTTAPPDTGKHNKDYYNPGGIESSAEAYDHHHSDLKDNCVIMRTTIPEPARFAPKEDESTFIVDNDDAFEFDTNIRQSPSDSCKFQNNSSSSDGSGRSRLRIRRRRPSSSCHQSSPNCTSMSPFHYCPPPPCVSAVTGTMFHLRFIGSLEVEEEVGTGVNRRKRAKKGMVEEAVGEIKAPDGETQPSTEVDLFISTEKIMVLNTDLKEIMMDHALRTISYIADIGDLVVLMARRRPAPSDRPEELSKIHRPPKMICHVFESDEAQYIAQSIGQAFQVAYMEFLKANGIEDHSFVREMDYQEVLNSQEIFGDELQMFAKKELQKDVVVPKAKGEILGVVIVESGWGSMLPTVVIANLAPAGAAARCGQLNIGDQIIAINGVSLVGLPLSTCQTYIKNSKTQTVVKLTVVPCPPVVEVKIKRPDTKYQLGFSVQNGVICSLLRGGIAERGGVRVGHRIIEINNQSVVAVPHEKIVNLLATSVGEINMKTMPTSMFRLLTGQETPLYI